MKWKWSGDGVEMELGVELELGNNEPFTLGEMYKQVREAGVKCAISHFEMILF